MSAGKVKASEVIFEILADLFAQVDGRKRMGTLSTFSMQRRAETIKMLRQRSWKDLKMSQITALEEHNAIPEHDDGQFLLVLIDPLDWSINGRETPDSLRYITGANRKFQPFYDRHYATVVWQAKCSGDTAKAAKASTDYIEFEDDGTFSAKDLKQGDIVWYGWMDKTRAGRIKCSANHAAVVVKVTDELLVLSYHSTLGPAAREAKRSRLAKEYHRHIRESRETLMASYIELMNENERRRNEAMQLGDIPQEDLDALAMMG